MISAHEATIISNTSESVKDRRMKEQLDEIGRVITEAANAGLKECLYDKLEIWADIYSDVIHELARMNYRLEDEYDSSKDYIIIKWGVYD